MKTKLKIILALLMVWVNITLAQSNNEGSKDRLLWLRHLDKLARPVIQNLAQDKLKERMAMVVTDTKSKAYRDNIGRLEAFGRTLMGIAPWLQLEGGSVEEVALRNQYRTWVLKAIANAVNPAAKDYMQWDGPQPLVDASFVAFGLVRCPWIWNHLDSNSKQQVITAFKTTRSTIPVYSNWILFSGMIETFFCKVGVDYDIVRIEYAIRQFAGNWYVGDGVYSDGADYHWDYYNSIVIHPGLANIINTVSDKTKAFEWYAPRLDTINKRYAEILERMINIDGSYPPTGRSITYRGGIFHHLADMSLRNKLPASLKPAQVRGALTAVIKKTMEAPNTYTNEGWLNIGLYGNQPSLAEFYITTGSLYICSNIFLPLGLPETNEFWSAPAVPWTAVKMWSGQDVPADHSLGGH